MADQPDNLVLEHLRAIRTKLDHMDQTLSTHSRGFAGIREALSGFTRLQSNDHSELMSLTLRPEHLEKRLDFQDAELGRIRSMTDAHEAEFKSLFELADRLERVETALSDDDPGPSVAREASEPFGDKS